MRRVLSNLTVLLVLGVLAGPVLPLAAPGSSLAAAGSPLASVRFIFHGLSVAAPGKGMQRARVGMSLEQRYTLRTTHGQRASIGFRDGTVLHINQDTDALLADPHVTRVGHGEVAEYLAPGTSHAIATSSAVAAAIGTTYDVRVEGGTATFIVLHGALEVSNPSGSVLVKSNHQSVVPQGQAPSPPTATDARAAFAWTEGIPTPDLGEDVALDANGGVVAGFSSQREGTGDAGHAFHIADGLLSQGWQSAAGKVRNQRVTIGFVGGNFYRISAVIVDPAATYGGSAAEDLKDFEIRVSSTDARDSSFTRVFQGTCRQRAELQRFVLSTPVRAKYVQLVALSNYGSTQRVAVAELEVVATASLFAQPYGLAVDAGGSLYVADTNANRVEKLSPKGRVIARWGKKGREHGQFLRPQAIAVDRRGNVYVADTLNNRVQKLSPTGKFLAQIGGPGLGPGKFSFPKGIVVDGAGNVYVSDTTASRIEKFGPDRKVLAVWSDVAGIGPFSQPEGIALDGTGNLIVADTGNGRLVRLSDSGAALATFGSKGSATGQFNQPSGVTVDPQGNVYVADSFNARVQKIDTGGHVTAWGAAGTGKGMFLLPSGVAADRHGHVFVADTGNSRIQRFNPDGVVQSVLGKYASVPEVLAEPDGIAANSRGDVFIADGVNDRLQQRASNGRLVAVLGHHGYVAGQPGTGLGQFWYPHGVAIDRQGAIYVADSFNNRIQVLANRGPIASYGTQGSAPGQFSVPFGVAADAAGNIFVADTGNNRVQKLSPRGRPLAQWGSRGSGPGQFLLPFGIAVDSGGNVWVSDYGDDRIQKLSPTGQPLLVLGPGGVRPRARFTLPQGLAVDSRDNLYVADSGHGSVQKITPAGQTVQVFDLPGPDASPTGVAVDGRGNVYVSDSLGGRVVVFAPSGEILGIWE